MEIPKIGGTRGIFEIFVPGSFLFINLVLIIGISIFPFGSPKIAITSDYLEIMTICDKTSRQITGLQFSKFFYAVSCTPNHTL